MAKGFTNPAEKARNKSGFSNKGGTTTIRKKNEKKRAAAISVTLKVDLDIFRPLLVIPEPGDINNELQDSLLSHQIALNFIHL